MNLIIDRGNSKTKLYNFTGDELTGSGPGPSPGNEAGFNWTEWLPSDPGDGIMISDVEGSYQGWQDLFGDFKSVIMSHELRFPVKLNYETPQTLGHDRIANCCGAWASNPEKTSVVIDCGTCLKIDVVDHLGRFIGGSISPGLRTRYRSLADYTGKLPLLEPLSGNIPYPGISTEGSMRSGVQNGILAEINAFLSRYKEDYPKLYIFLTGGDMEYFAAILKSPIFVAPDLTARGLNEILKLNLP
jgi:type III pantothenate kinase